MITMELNDDQFRLLLDLVETRIGELHSEIRRSQTYSIHDALQHDLEVLQDLRDRLHQAKDKAVI